MIPDYETFQIICEEANVAGNKAVESARIIPMVVGQETHFMSGEMIPESMEYVADGVCGFAWVEVYPEYKGHTRLGKQERKVLEQSGFQKDWASSKKYTLWISDFDQSMQKKEAYALAYADVLREHGIKAAGRSRMD